MALMPSLVCSWPLYSGTAPPGLCRVLARLGLRAVAVALALTAGGCSFSYQLGSLFEKSKEQGAPETTASIFSSSFPNSEPS